MGKNIKSFQNFIINVLNLLIITSKPVDRSDKNNFHYFFQITDNNEEGLSFASDNKKHLN